MHPFRRFLFVRDVFFQMHHVDHIYLPIYLTISKSICLVHSCLHLLRSFVHLCLSQQSFCAKNDLSQQNLHTEGYPNPTHEWQASSEYRQQKYEHQSQHDKPIPCKHESQFLKSLVTTCFSEIFGMVESHDSLTRKADSQRDSPEFLKAFDSAGAIGGERCISTKGSSWWRRLIFDLRILWSFWLPSWASTNGCCFIVSWLCHKSFFFSKISGKYMGFLNAGRSSSSARFFV